jgi:RNA-dependent RNA polymerase
MREVTTVLVRDIRDELKGDENSTLDDWLRRSYIAWKLSMLAIEDEVYGAQSFWWVSLGAVFDAVRAIKTEEEGNDWV